MLEEARTAQRARREDDERGGRDGRRRWRRGSDRLMSSSSTSDTPLVRRRHHRPRGHVPHAQQPQLRHQRRRRGHARQGRPGRRGHSGVRQLGRRRAPRRGANTAMIFVPPRFAADSVLEAADAGVELIIAITEGIPAHDELRVYNTAQARPPEHAPDRTQLPRHPLAGQGQRRHHPGVLLQAGQRRRRLALGHADLPDRQRAGPRRLRQLARSSASAATPFRAPRSSTSSSCSRRTTRPS